MVDFRDPVDMSLADIGQRHGRLTGGCEGSYSHQFNTCQGSSLKQRDDFVYGDV